MAVSAAFGQDGSRALNAIHRAGQGTHSPGGHQTGRYRTRPCVDICLGRSLPQAPTPATNRTGGQPVASAGGREIAATPGRLQAQYRRAG